MSELTLTSTTDSQEAVNAALGIEPEKPAVPEVKEPETEPAPESKEEVPEDSETSDVDEQEEVETPEPPKKKGGFQKRIDKLTSETYQLQAEKAELQRQLALHAAKPAEPAKPEATEGEPKAESFDSYEKYVRAVAKYELRQELAAERKAQADQVQAAERNKAQAEFQKQTQTVREKYEDFDQVVSNPTLHISPVMYDVILNSDQGAELAYQLGKNPAEAARIASLHPIAAARELGKLEAKISKPVTATEAAPPKTTKAPAPIKPVGTKPAASSKSPDDMSFQEYKKWRESNN